MASPELETTMRSPAAAPPRPRAIKLLLVTAGISLLAGGGLLGVGMTLFYPLEFLFIAWGVTAALLGWCLTVVIVLRGAHLLSADRLLKTLPLTAIGPAVLGAGAIVFANGALDPDPIMEHQLAVIDTQVSGIGSRQSLQLVVSDWREGRAGKTLTLHPLEPDLFQGIQKGDKVLVIVAPGLIDWWIRDLIPLTRPAGS